MLQKALFCYLAAYDIPSARPQPAPAAVSSRTNPQYGPRTHHQDSGGSVACLASSRQAAARSIGRNLRKATRGRGRGVGRRAIALSAVPRSIHVMSSAVRGSWQRTISRRSALPTRSHFAIPRRCRRYCKWRLTALTAVADVQPARARMGRRRSAQKYSPTSYHKRNLSAAVRGR
jgi:hypothetical protein